MANAQGDTFISKGIEYVLDLDSDGKLRPYTLGPVETGQRSWKEAVVGIACLAAVGAAIGGIAYWIDSMAEEN